MPPRLVLALATVLLPAGCDVSSRGTKGQPAPQGKKADPPARHDPLIEGTWRVIAAERAGKPFAEPLDTELTFQGGLLIVRHEGRRKEGAYQTRPDGQPREIDLTVTTRGKTEHDRGIYTVSAGRLILCTAEKDGPRPAALTSEGRKDVVLLVLESVRP